MTTMLTIHGIRYRAEDAEAQGLMPAYHAQQEAARLQATHHDPEGGDTDAGDGAGGEGGSAVDTSTAEGKARTTRNKARGPAATKAEGQ